MIMKLQPFPRLLKEFLYFLYHSIIVPLVNDREAETNSDIRTPRHAGFKEDSLRHFQALHQSCGAMSTSRLDRLRNTVLVECRG